MWSSFEADNHRRYFLYFIRCSYLSVVRTWVSFKCAGQQMETTSNCTEHVWKLESISFTVAKISYFPIVSLIFFDRSEVHHDFTDTIYIQCLCQIESRIIIFIFVQVLLFKELLMIRYKCCFINRLHTWYLGTTTVTLMIIWANLHK